MSILTNPEATLMVECTEPNCERFGTGHEESKLSAERPVLHTRGAADGVTVQRMGDALEWSVDIDVRADMNVADARRLERVISAAVSDAEALNSAARTAAFTRFGDYARHICDVANVTDADLVKVLSDGKKSVARIFRKPAGAITVTDIGEFADATGMDPFDLLLDWSKLFASTRNSK